MIRLHHKYNAYNLKNRSSAPIISGDNDTLSMDLFDGGQSSDIIENNEQDEEIDFTGTPEASVTEHDKLFNNQRRYTRHRRQL